MRDRRDYRDRHVGRPRSSTWHPRRSRRSASPSANRRQIRSPNRKISPVHRRPVHQVHSPIHFARPHHSVSLRDQPYDDFPPLNQMRVNYPSVLDQEMGHHKPHGLDPVLGRPYQPKQDGILGDVMTGGSHEGDFNHMERSLYGRERENPLSPAMMTSRGERNRERSCYARERENPLVGGTVPVQERERERSLYVRERENPLTGAVPVQERERERSHYMRERENPLTGTVPVPVQNPLAERERERNHYAREAPLAAAIPNSRVERDRERDHYARDPTLSSTIPARTDREREREMNHHARDAPLSPLAITIANSRAEREREREKNHHTREAPLSATLPTSHLRPMESGPVSYPSLYHNHAYEKSSDDLLSRRDPYNSLASDEMYKKMPYQSDYARHDGFSPRGRRNERVFVDPVHSKHDTGLNYSPRPMHMHHMLPFDDDVAYRIHRDGPCVASYRERSESPVFSERGKAIAHRPEHFSFHAHDNYVGNNSEFDLPHGGPMGRRHHVHMHVHERDDLYNDDISDTDGDLYGSYIPKRIPVKDRIVEREDRGPNRPVRERISRPFSAKIPPFSRAKFRVPHEAIYHGKNMKKRLRPGPSDFDRNEGYKPSPHKFHKRLLLDPQNENELENENENEMYDGDNSARPDEELGHEKENDDGGMIYLRRDPPEGSEEFKRELEKAFIKFATKINGTSREKRKYLQPGGAGLHCYVCGSESKIFAETHNLVVHTYHTKKPGMKTSHLGLQKALCLLMGWNWLKVPDESRSYQIAPPGEAKVIKQDLLIWPPFVVICNSSINSKVSKPNVITIPEIESMLKGIGIEEGKGKVSYGKPANQSVLLVKFEPTLPGYELAKILHNHFSNKNHGKEHFDQLILNRTNKEREKTNEKNGDGTDKEEILYGYIAGIEDLDKLDGLKVKIKSKRKEIEAIVNAS